MQPLQRFDYDRPTRDSLVGINVVASDSAEAAHVEAGSQVAAGTIPYLEELFGYMVCVDENRVEANVRD